MKLIYCIRALYNPGGMERVLLNKVTYLVEKLYWDVTIITTDQQGLPSFYSFPNGVRMIDLGINYADDNEKNVLLKIAGYLKRRKEHKRKLSALLEKERAERLHRETRNARRRRKLPQAGQHTVIRRALRT